MKNDTANLREDFQNLLCDICEFLNNDITDKELPPEKLDLKEMLIKRIKIQLSKLSISDFDLPSYVDMTHKKEDASEYVYSDCKEVQPLENNDDIDKIKTVEKIYSECPYSALAAKKIPHEEKYGLLVRREKLLFLGHDNKLFACILGEWLLLYYNKGEAKPFETYDLKSCEAKEGKKENCFTLIPKDNKSNFKSQYFTALSSNDAIQWISKINKISNPSSYVSVAKHEETKIVENTQPSSVETLGAATNFVNDLKAHMGRFSSVQNDNNYDLVGSPRHSNDYCQISETENDYDVISAQPIDSEYDVIKSPEPPEKEEIYDCINPTIPKKKSILATLSFRKKRKSYK